MKRKTETRYPKGWNAKRVADVLDYYENQTDEEAAAEIEEGLAAEQEACPRSDEGSSRFPSRESRHDSWLSGF